jgi:hypothetical protein
MKNLTSMRAILGAAVFACGLAGSSQAAITTDLAVHLTFDDNLTDASGNGINGTPVGNPLFVGGVVGKAVSVTTLKDGSQFDYVSLGQPDSLKFGADVDFTISFWCNITNQVDDIPFISNKNWVDSNNQGWVISTQSGGNFRVNTTDDGGSSHKQDIKQATVLSDGTWHLVTISYARSTAASIYVDGSLVATSPLTMVTGSIDTDYDITIGQDGTGSYTDSGNAQVEGMMIDDLGIWRRVLSGGEIAAIYDAGKKGKDLAQVTAPAQPFVDSVSPTLNATVVKPTASIVAAIKDGVNSVASDSIKLSVNGAAVTPTITKAGTVTTVKYVPSGLLVNGLNTVVLVFGDNATPQTLSTNTWSFTSSYAVLPADTKVTADTSKRGFIWNIFANSANFENTNEHTEQALLGMLVDADGTALPNNADPNAQSIALAPAATANPVNAPISFEVDSTINFGNSDGSTFGLFTPDNMMPGLPAVDGSVDGVEVEILTYVELPAGATTMAVFSDDGYKVAMGAAQDVIQAVVASEYQGFAGSAQYFNVYAPEAGVYPFRVLYENGQSGGHVEWFTVKDDGTNVLLNDTDNGGLKAYRAVSSGVQPTVKYVSPAIALRQLHDVASSVVVAIADGTAKVNDSSIILKLDGNVVTTSKQRLGNNVRVSYVPTTAQIPGDLHTAELSFQDVTGASKTSTWQFYNLKNIVLPAPVVMEDFESYAEGAVPTGWNAWNYTDTVTAGDDLDNFESDSYKGWIVISVDRATAHESDFMNVAANQSVNGQAVTSLCSGNVLYAESDSRSGNQAQFIVTKAYDMAKVTNVVVTVSSIYKQNQDNLGAVEYSVDGGANWLPVVYYLNGIAGGNDIYYNADGSVDAVKTFTAKVADTAVWEVDGVQKGGNYGDGLAAPITAALGRYVVPRYDDEKTSDKRVELFRLPKAGLASDVRLRFAQLGTGSWYFAIDNLAFYEGPAPVAGATVEKAQFNVTTHSGQSVTISWTGTGALQEAASVSGPWSDSASQSNPQTVTATGSKFYRIKQ